MAPYDEAGGVLLSLRDFMSTAFPVLGQPNAELKPNSDASRLSIHSEVIG